LGQCGGCRLPATLRDPTSGKAYTGGYLNPVECLLDPDIGVENLFSNDLRLNLAHHEIVAQGKMIEDSWMAVRHSQDSLARYEELKSATSCRGQSTPITTLGYTNASSFFEYPVAHCLALGIHCQFFKDMRDILFPDEFNRACKRTDKRCAYILRLFILKRPVKRILPELSLYFLSGYKVEDQQHSMECYHVLLFRRVFTHGPERESFSCDVSILDTVYFLYWRFLSCAMFLYRGADRTVATAANSTELLQARNAVILKHKKNFDMDVDILCKLCEEVFGPSSCTPNLHSLHHMIRRLIVLKSHPTFEMIVERLVSNSEIY
jgi:hypothetical protein